MYALDRDLYPMWMPRPDHPSLMQYRGGNAEIDARIERWFAAARRDALAYRQQLRPQTKWFATQLAEFDRCHAETSESRRHLIWRLPALSIAINRALHDSRCEQPVLWRLYALHLADFAELKASGFPCLPVRREHPYARMAGTLLKVASEGAP